MLVQYLVGLCCLRRNPDAVHVILGDMVLDPAAGKERDVDVTVTVEEAPGTVRAFKAYEVKREQSPLDVAEVEQLCAKLRDMPLVTNRAIVSASGFSQAAQRKAGAHGVELFEITPWVRPLREQFPALGMHAVPADCLRFARTVLYWRDPRLSLVAPTGPPLFSVAPGDPIFAAPGTVHPDHPTFAALQDALLLRSTEILYTLEPAQTVLRTFPGAPLANQGGIPQLGPRWPHTHTLDVARDGIYVLLGSQFVRVEQVTITGFLQWETTIETPLYHVLQRVPDGEVFAAAMIGVGQREYEMFALVFLPDSHTAAVHLVRLAPQHRSVIRRLTLQHPGGTEVI